MEKNLFLLLLLTGVPPVAQSVHRKYYLIQQAKTWSDAQAYCRSTYADLAIIEMANDVVQLQKEAQKYQFNSNAWIGLWNDINSWRWSFGSEPLGTWTSWGPTEPNNQGGHEECGGTNNLEVWLDVPCSLHFPFVCFNERYIGPERFIYYDILKTWPEARTLCKQFHTDLANPRNSTENAAMVKLTKGNTFWIGLFRDSWKWSDQTNFSTVSWMAGQPDNAARNENCGYISNGLVGDAPCSNTWPFFCYQVITGQQQIVRVRVQSDQDVNDPALKAAILQQINQKLNDSGMENVTVRWREGPGGVMKS